MKREIEHLERQGAPDDEFGGYELHRVKEEMAAVARNLAKRIVDDTNNGPTAWDVVSSTLPRKQRLSKASIIAGIDDKFGSRGNPIYRHMFGRDFDFSARFGVLARKE